MKFESFSAEETEKIAYAIGETAKKGQIYCLEGSLGAGKTAFSKGFAMGLGIEESITSPTFTIVNEYGGRINLYHFDVYRLESSEELYNIGFEEYFYGDGVCLIEWASIVADVIPEHAVWIKIGKDALQGENYRQIEILKDLKG